MPAPGEVDVVIAAELMEAGRVDPARPGHARPHDADRLDAPPLCGRREGEARRRHRRSRQWSIEGADVAAKRVIAFDMETLANRNSSVISACLFGALAGSGRPAVRARSLRGGDQAPAARGVEPEPQRVPVRRMRRPRKQPSAARATAPSRPSPAKRLASLPDIPPASRSSTRCWRASANFRGRCTTILFAGVQAADRFPGSRLCQRVSRPARRSSSSSTSGNGGATKAYALTEAAAKYVAVAMAYDDVIRVADLKTRPAVSTA